MMAGRELDALVAEKVMGRDMTRPSGFKYPLGMPRYSTEIAAAWRLYPAFAYFEVGHDETWYCCLGRAEGDHLSDHVLVFAETAPLAICLAALKAVATKKEGK